MERRSLGRFLSCTSRSRCTLPLFPPGWIRQEADPSRQRKAAGEPSRYYRALDFAWSDLSHTSASDLEDAARIVAVADVRVLSAQRPRSSGAGRLAGPPSVVKKMYSFLVCSPIELTQIGLSCDGRTGGPNGRGATEVRDRGPRG